MLYNVIHYFIDCKCAWGTFAIYKICVGWRKSQMPSRKQTLAPKFNTFLDYFWPMFPDNDGAAAFRSDDPNLNDKLSLLALMTCLTIHRIFC